MASINKPKPAWKRHVRFIKDSHMQVERVKLNRKFSGEIHLVESTKRISSRFKRGKTSFLLDWINVWLIHFCPVDWRICFTSEQGFNRYNQIGFAMQSSPRLTRLLSLIYRHNYCLKNSKEFLYTRINEYSVCVWALVHLNPGTIVRAQRDRVLDIAKLYCTIP